MSKKKSVPAKKKSASKTISPKTAKPVKSTGSKKPLSKKPAAKSAKVTPKPAAKSKPVSKTKLVSKVKPAAKTKPTAKARPAAPKKNAPKTSPKAIKAPAKSAKKAAPRAKPTPAKKAPAKPAAPSVKPKVLKSAPVGKKAKPAVKRPTKTPPKAAPTAKVKVPVPASATKSAAKPTTPAKSTKSAKPSGAARDLPKAKSATRTVRPAISFNLEDIKEYLKQRQNVKLNAYVPEDADIKAAPTAAAKKVALLNEQKIKARSVGAVSVADILGFNPFKKDAPEREEDQIPTKWRKYYKLLIDLRTNLQDGLSLHTEEALKKSGKEESGDLSGYSQHMADAGTDSFDRDFALSLVSNEQEALAEIAEAIDRMHKGKYGVCEITGKAIPADRLTAVPFTRYSLEGQRELERSRRNRRRGGMLGNPLAELGDGVNFGATEESDEA